VLEHEPTITRRPATNSIDANLFIGLRSFHNRSAIMIADPALIREAISMPVVNAGETAGSSGRRPPT
jgi:hypothetical protein